MAAHTSSVLLCQGQADGSCCQPQGPWSWSHRSHRDPGADPTDPTEPSGTWELIPQIPQNPGSWSHRLHRALRPHRNLGADSTETWELIPQIPQEGWGENPTGRMGAEPRGRGEEQIPQAGGEQIPQTPQEGWAADPTNPTGRRGTDPKSHRQEGSRSLRPHREQGGDRAVTPGALLRAAGGKRNTQAWLMGSQVTRTLQESFAHTHKRTSLAPKPEEFNFTLSVVFSLGKFYNKNIFHGTQWKAVLKLILQFLFPVLPLYSRNKRRVTGYGKAVDWISEFLWNGLQFAYSSTVFYPAETKLSHPDWRVLSKSKTLEHLRVSWLLSMKNVPESKKHRIPPCVPSSSTGIRSTTFLLRVNSSQSLLKQRLIIFFFHIFQIQNNSFKQLLPALGKIYST